MHSNLKEKYLIKSSNLLFNKARHNIFIYQKSTNYNETRHCIIQHIVQIMFSNNKENTITLLSK